MASFDTIIRDARVATDADLVIRDADLKRTLTHDHLHDGADHTPYEGLEITGWPVLTMVRGNIVGRGKIVVRDGVLHGAKGHGRYLARQRSACV